MFCKPSFLIGPKTGSYQHGLLKWQIRRNTVPREAISVRSLDLPAVYSPTVWQPSRSSGHVLPCLGSLQAVTRGRSRATSVSLCPLLASTVFVDSIIFSLWPKSLLLHSVSWHLYFKIWSSPQLVTWSLFLPVRTLRGGWCLPYGSGGSTSRKHQPASFTFLPKLRSPLPIRAIIWSVVGSPGCASRVCYGGMTRVTQPRFHFTICLLRDRILFLALAWAGKVTTSNPIRVRSWPGHLWTSLIY